MPPTQFQPVILPGADVSLLPDLDLGWNPDAILQELIEQIPWRAETILLWGKRIPQPRLTAWYGDPGRVYRYSGLNLAPLPWTPLLSDLRERVEHAAGCAFNSVLLNFYRNEHDSIALHSDDEAELGPEPVIASLSLGAERVFVMKHKTEKSIRPVRMALPSGSLLLMRGATQKNWKHGVEKRRAAAGPRINLTFRRIMAERKDSPF